MSSNLIHSFADLTQKEAWIGYAQEALDKSFVAKPLSRIYSGTDRVLHNPWRTRMIGTDGTATNAYSTEVSTTTDDTVTIDRRAVAAFNVDSLEQMQAGDNFTSERATEAGYTLGDKIDRFVLGMGHATAGVGDIDDGYVSTGVASGTPFNLSNTNADDMSNTILQSLMLSNANTGNVSWVVSPIEVAKITSFKQNAGLNSYSSDAIRAGLNGYKDQFGGLDIYMSNNLTHEVDLTLATNPTDGDTVTFLVNDQNFTFTFKATPAAEGDVDIEASAALTQASFRAAFNQSGTGDGSDYIAFTGETLTNLKNVQPISNTGVSSGCAAFAADVATITVYGTLRVAETLTAGGDGFSTVRRHTLALVPGSIHLAMPAGGMTYKNIDRENAHGKHIALAQVYQAKVWYRMLPKVKDVVLQG